MRSQDAVFTTHVYRITIPSLRTQWQIIPYGDIHYDSPQHDGERFGQFCKMAKHEKLLTWFLGLGDDNELLSSKERKNYDRAELHESSAERFERMIVKSHCDLRDKIVGFGRGRTIGMIQGNHYWKFTSSHEEHGISAGQTTNEWLAEQVGCKWLGWLSYIRIVVSSGDTTKIYTVDVVACHGKAGGKLVGSSVNQVDDLRKIFPMANIYIMGHDHKRGAWPDSALHAESQVKAENKDKLRIKQKRQWLVRSGSFLKGYVDGEESYVVGRLLRPAELGIVKIQVQADRIETGKQDIVIPNIHVWT